jgi:hypothetical protein
MYDIGHLYASLNGRKVMLMVPKGVRSKTLFVDKVNPLLYMRDLRHPIKRDSEQGFDLVLDDLPGVHPFTVIAGDDVELHVRRRYALQISGIREKIPGFFW